MCFFRSKLILPLKCIKVKCIKIFRCKGQLASKVLLKTTGDTAAPHFHGIYVLTKELYFTNMGKGPLNREIKKIYYFRIFNMKMIQTITIHS